MTNGNLADEEQQLAVRLDKKMNRYFGEVIWPHYPEEQLLISTFRS